MYPAHKLDSTNNMLCMKAIPNISPLLLMSVYLKLPHVYVHLTYTRLKQQPFQKWLYALLLNGLIYGSCIGSLIFMGPDSFFRTPQKFKSLVGILKEVSHIINYIFLGRGSNVWTLKINTSKVSISMNISHSDNHMVLGPGTVVRTPRSRTFPSPILKYGSTSIDFRCLVLDLMSVPCELLGPILGIRTS